MSFPLANLLSDDDTYDDVDFDVEFDADYEFLSDEEFEVFIDDDEYASDDYDFPGNEFCLEDDIDYFGDFDDSEEALAEKDQPDEAP